MCRCVYMRLSLQDERALPQRHNFAQLLHNNDRFLALAQAVASHSSTLAKQQSISLARVCVFLLSLCRHGVFGHTLADSVGTNTMQASLQRAGPPAAQAATCSGRRSGVVVPASHLVLPRQQQRSAAAQLVMRQKGSHSRFVRLEMWGGGGRAERERQRVVAGAIATGVAPDVLSLPSLPLKTGCWRRRTRARSAARPSSRPTSCSARARSRCVFCCRRRRRCARAP